MSRAKEQMPVGLTEEQMARVQATIHLILRTPFTKRTWSELLYLSAGVPLAAGAFAFVVLRWGSLGAWTDRLETPTWCLVIPAISAYLAMNFTGASTYTSLSGVKKEMRLAVPLQVGAGIVGLGLWLGLHFIA